MSLTVNMPRDTFEVREPCTVALEVRSTDALEPGDTVEFQFPNSWLVVTGPSFTRKLQADDPGGEHYVAVEADGARFGIEIRPRHLTFAEVKARHGRCVVATLAEGSLPAGTPVRVRYANTLAPYVAETETLWLQVKGEAAEPAAVLTTTSGPARTVRVIVPSGARPGESFDVLIVSLDAFDNLSSTRFERQVLVRGDGEVLVEALDFTGGVRVPVTIDEEGVHRFRMGEHVSNAVRVSAGARGPYWGDLHIHTGLSHDGQGNDPYGYARDVSGLDFAGCADHVESLGEEGYRIARQWARDACEPGRFVAFLGDERNPPAAAGAHYNVLFRDEDAFERNVFPADGPPPSDVVALKDRWRELTPGSALLFPHHTGIRFGDLPLAGGEGVSFERFDPGESCPIMEVYSHHGQSEVYDPQHVLAYEFNRMRNPERRANTSLPGPHYAQDFWMAGRRLGVIGSSDEHAGQGGRRHGGIAGVFADELTGEGIFDALRARQCYATTGERILLEFAVDGVAMGNEATRAKGRRLAIRLRVWGTDLLLRVEILRYRRGLDSAFRPVVSAAPRPERMDAEFELEDELAADTVYYARVTQAPLQWPGMAWTSPVWIDLR